MYRYIIVALCLVAVWGCSDDKVTTPEEKETEKVDERFKTINGMEIFYNDFITIDTLGDASLIFEHCPRNGESAVFTLPSASSNTIPVFFTLDKPQEVVMSIETVLTSQKVKDDFIKLFNVPLIDHKSYKEIFVYYNELEAGNHTITINPHQDDAGAYIVKLKREDGSINCIPIVYMNE